MKYDLDPNRAYIPLSDPSRQLEPVLDFCTTWGEPIYLSYQGKVRLLAPIEWYYANCCSPEERAEIEAAAQAFSAKFVKGE